MSNIRKLESLNKEEALDALQNAYGIYACDVYKGLSYRATINLTGVTTIMLAG